jgi:hypothetical protein
VIAEALAEQSQKRLYCDYKVTANRLQSDCKPIAKRKKVIQGDSKAFTQRLRGDYVAIVKGIHSDYGAIVR